VHAYAAWVERHAPQRRRTAQLCLEALERGLATTASLLPSEAPLCFCRSDPRFANVLTRPDGRLGLVDWEDSGLRDPAREVADLLLHPNQEDLLDAHGWKAFLTPYPASRRSHPGFQDRLRGYLGHLPRFLAWPPARRRPGSGGARRARGVAGQRARAQ
jgi:thiamine kinase-like enzyme